MRTFFAVALAALVCGCATYSVPVTQAQVNINLLKSEVTILGDVKSTDWSFGIFPLYLLVSTSYRAANNAIGKANEAAYEKAGAEFLIQPKSRTTYYNFILFDVATSEVQGKGAKINQ